MLQKAGAELRIHGDINVVDKGRSASAQLAGADSAESQPEVQTESPRKERCSAIGGRAWISKKGIDYLVKQFKPEIIKVIENLEISPRKNVSYGFKYRIWDFKIAKLKIGEPKVNFARGEGLRVNVPNVSVAVSLRYRIEGADWWNPLYTGGKVKAIVARDTTGSGMVGVEVSPEGNPHIKAQMDRLDIKLQKIKLYGTKLGGLVEFFAKLFQDSIEDLIADEIQYIIEWFLNDKLNVYMDKLDLAIPLPLPGDMNISTVDLRLCSVNTGANFMSLDVRGEVVDLSKPEMDYPEKPADIPYGPPVLYDEFEKSMMMLTLTKWTVNSGLWLFHEEGLLKHLIVQSDIPDNSPIVLNADTLRPLIMGSPDVPRWWWNPTREGQRREFALEVAATEVPKVELKDGSIELTAQTNIGFRLDGVPTADLYASTVHVPIKVNVGLGIRRGVAERDMDGTKAPQVLDTRMDYASASPITMANARSRSMGVASMNLWAMTGFVSMLANTVLIPGVNVALKDGVEFPSAMGVSLVDSNVTLTDVITFKTDIDVNATKVMEIAYYGTEEVDDDFVDF